MTYTGKLALLAAAVAIAAFGASASAQTPNTPITVIGAINAPAHVQPVTDGRDNAVPEMPVVYENQDQRAMAQAQPTAAHANTAKQTADRSVSTRGADLGQAVKSQ